MDKDSWLSLIYIEGLSQQVGNKKKIKMRGWTKVSSYFSVNSGSKQYCEVKNISHGVSSKKRSKIGEGHKVKPRFCTTGNS